MGNHYIINLAQFIKLIIFTTILFITSGFMIF